jgi:hypothetical protein
VRTELGVLISPAHCDAGDDKATGRRYDDNRNRFGRKHLRAALEILRGSREKYPFERIGSHKFPLEKINEVFAAQNEGHITRASLVL